MSWTDASQTAGDAGHAAASVGRGLPKPRASVSGYARYVGRIGALAFALGVGAAIASMPAVAFADTAGSAGSNLTSGSSSGADSSDSSGSGGSFAGGVRGEASSDSDSSSSSETEGPADTGAVEVEADLDVDEVLDDVVDGDAGMGSGGPIDGDEDTVEVVGVDEDLASDVDFDDGLALDADFDTDFHEGPGPGRGVDEGSDSDSDSDVDFDEDLALDADLDEGSGPRSTGSSDGAGWPGSASEVESVDDIRLISASIPDADQDWPSLLVESVAVSTAVHGPVETDAAAGPATTSPWPLATTNGPGREQVAEIPERAPRAKAQTAAAMVTPFSPQDAPGAPASSPAPLAVYAWTRREIEQSLVDRTTESSTAHQVGVATADPMAPEPGPAAAETNASTRVSIETSATAKQNWFKRMFSAARPTFSAQSVTLSIGPGAVSAPFGLGAEGSDTHPLTYTVDGKAAGTGTSAGALNISGESATYTPPPGWDGATPLADRFTVTASDADGGFHIHGVAGLINLLSFGLLGDAGHTATGTLTVNVLAVPAAPEPEPPAPEPEPPAPPEVPVAAGSFPVSFSNETGVYGNDEVHVMVIGQATPGQWSWVDRKGTVHAIDHRAADAPGHLEKNGVNYADMSFTLAEAGNLRIPPELLGGRIYVSLEEPLYVAISGDDTGWASPDPANPADPNYGTIYDWYELSFKNGSVPFGGNTTQVDQFGFPFTFTLTQDSSGFSGTRGIALARDEVFQRFEDTVPAEFQALVIKDADGNPLRILAPRSQQPAGLADWFDEPVEDFWGKYKNEQFVFNGPGYAVTGGIDAEDRFAYTVTTPGGASTEYAMDKPTTQDIFRADGPFVGTALQGAFLAELDAAFHRGVATSPSDWTDTSAYYPEGQRWNNWAQFFHANSVEGFAYGFPYDDVNSQSSVLILNNSEPLTNLALALTPSPQSAPSPQPAPEPPTAPGTGLTAADRAYWAPERGVGFSVGSLGALEGQTRLEEALQEVADLGFTMVRTWGTDQYTGRILEAITRLNLPLKVQPGVYITHDADARGQIDSALSIITSYEDKVLGVSLGNEQLADWNTSATLVATEVTDQVRYFKSVSSLPVTYDFSGATFLPDSSQWEQDLVGLVQELDYVSVHDYGGFFENRDNPAWTPALQLASVTSYETTLADTLASLGLGSKPIILGETGWQSKGYHPTVTNPANMQQFYELISRYVYGPDARFDGMYYFNFTDEAWKGGDDHWGLFGEGAGTGIGAPKFAIVPVPQILAAESPAPEPGGDPGSEEGAPVVTDVILPLGAQPAEFNASARIIDADVGVNKAYLDFADSAGLHASAFRMWDDGSHGDVQAGDDVYSASGSIELPAGTYSVTVLAHDAQFNAAQPLVGYVDVSAGGVAWRDSATPDPGTPEPAPAGPPEPALPAGTNLLRNPTFADGLSAWEASGEVSSIHDNDPAVRLSATETIDARITQRVTELKPQTLYTLAVTMRTSGLVPSDVWGVWGVIDGPQLDKTGSGQSATLAERHLTVYTGADSTEVTVFVAAGRNAPPGEVTVTDVKFVEGRLDPPVVDPAEPGASPPPLVTLPGSGENLVTNGRFESDTHGWVLDQAVRQPDGTVRITSTPERTARIAQDLPMLLAPEREYLLTAKARVDAGDATITVASPDGSLHASQLVTDTAWQPVEIPFTTPDRWVSVKVAAENWRGDDNTLEVDNITILANGDEWLDTPNPYPSPQPELFDDFTNGIDPNRWLIADKAWGGDNGGVVPANVEVLDGFVRLRAHGDEYGGDVVGHGGRTTRVGATIATRDYYASGRYEVRARTAGFGSGECILELSLHRVPPVATGVLD